MKENYDLMINIQGDTSIPPKLMDWIIVVLEETSEEIVTGMNPMSGDTVYRGGPITISRLEARKR